MASLCDSCKNNCKQQEGANVVVCPDYEKDKTKKILGVNNG